MNPYSVSTKTPLQTGFFGDHASRTEGAFLYRVVEISKPIATRFVYSGWWFRQTIDFDGLRVWSKISWLTIDRVVSFELPWEIDGQRRSGRVEIDFGRGLQIRRFRIWIGDDLVYDEVT